jgi:predicted deacylase
LNEDVQLVEELELEMLTPGRFHKLALHLVDDAASNPVLIPIIVARGVRPGPVVGVNAAIHGNELNGIPTIHNLLKTIEPLELKGTVVAVTIANVPGFHRNTRRFTDGADLNRIMPGRPNGNVSEVYAHRFLHKVVAHFQYMIDLHTASFGRVNSLYIRADMGDPVCARMARLMGPEIIVHNAGGDGTLRGAAADLGVKSVTVEIGDPQTFQRSRIRTSRIGIRDVIEDLGMVAPDHEAAEDNAVECKRSFWIYTDRGGLLTVEPQVCDHVVAGQTIGRLFDPWGDLLAVYEAPNDGIVVGKSTNPVAATGARILHLGILA